MGKCLLHVPNYYLLCLDRSKIGFGTNYCMRRDSEDVFAGFVLRSASATSLLPKNKAEVRHWIVQSKSTLNVII